jgi:conjugative transfer region protein TrbK
MNGSNGTSRLLFAGTAAAIVAGCAIQLRDNSDSALPATQSRYPVAAELESCRTVTSEHAAELQECRWLWSENRRRLLQQRKAPTAPTIDAQPGTPPPSQQVEDLKRVLGNQPPVATPKSE